MSCPSKAILPGGRAQAAGDEAEERALAGAVRPDQAVAVPFLEVEVHAVDGAQPAERDAHIAQLEHAHVAVRHQRARPSRPATPPGNRYTQRMKTSPSSNGPCPPSETPISSRT